MDTVQAYCNVTITAAPSKIEKKELAQSVTHYTPK